MKIGIVGTGKLGLPVSLVYATKGHDILAYDIDEKFYGGSPADFLFKEELAPDNNGKLYEWIKTHNINYKHVALDQVAKESEIIFVAIQTPHEKEYEGVTRLPDKRIDFNYDYLINGIKQLSISLDKAERNIPVIIISTVLPGTINKYITPILSRYAQLCYNPYFIAMGTVARDCLFPEFILLGENNGDHVVSKVQTFYKTITDSPIFNTNIENAEMIKVCYNTFISTKIAMTNTIMQLCHYTPGTNCDTIIDALSMATSRLISPAYLRGGMGDGGGCHPRDNIALSWYSGEKGLKYDWFDFIMKTRENQIDFLADLIETEYKNNNLPVYILGISFKPDTAITTGSSAVLLCNILNERKINFKVIDPVADQSNIQLDVGTYFIGCNHSIFKNFNLPDGSVLIDPFRKFCSILTKGKYIPVGIHI